MDKKIRGAIKSMVASLICILWLVIIFANGATWMTLAYIIVIRCGMIDTSLLAYFVYLFAFIVGMSIGYPGASVVCSFLGRLLKGGE